MNKETENEIEKTLNSLNDLTGAKTDPYFYTRLTSRVENARASAVYLRWALATTFVVIILNAVFISNYSVLEEAEVDTVETLAVEYGTEWPSLYDNDISYENE